MKIDGEHLFNPHTYVSFGSSNGCQLQSVGSGVAMEDGKVL